MHRTPDSNLKKWKTQHPVSAYRKIALLFITTHLTNIVKNLYQKFSRLCLAFKNALHCKMFVLVRSLCKSFAKKKCMILKMGVGHCEFGLDWGLVF